MSDDRLARGTTEHYLDAALYDLEYADRVDDIRWYRRQARAALNRGDTILELGAGTGRITCALARSGYHVIALDAMAPMLAALSDKIEGKAIAERIDVLRGDMRRIDLADRSVPMVIAPFNAMMHLYTWEDLLACVREVRRVLKPGGTFAFDVHLPDLPWLLWSPKKRHGITRITHPTTGERLVWSANHRYDACTQICDITIYYDPAPPRGQPFVPPRRSKRRVKLAHRQIFPQELRALVHAAGLTIDTVTADFTNADLHGDALSQCVVCRAPGRRRKPTASARS